MNKSRKSAQVMAADCLCFRARRVSRALTRMYDEALRPLGIAATQLTLLNAIVMAGHGAPPGTLADILAMDQTTLSRSLRPLERAGLLEIARHAEDRRVRVARLTPAGERVVEDALPLWTRAHERVVAALGREASVELRDRFDAAVAAATAGTLIPQP
jgi:DNA-binding MarR family transcriptional regulator